MSIITENLEMEYSIFYSIFKYGERAIQRAKSFGLDVEHFVNPFHKEMFGIVLDLYKEGKVLSIKAFRQHYFNNPMLDPENKITFAKFGKAINANKIVLDDVRHITETLMQFYGKRKYIKQMQNSIAELESGGKISEILEDTGVEVRKIKSSIEIDNVKSTLSLKGDLPERIRQATERKNNPNSAGMVVTGLKNLDKHIGKQSPGQFIIYQARTGIGKSMMLMGTGLANFRAGLKVLIVTIEMSAFEYLYRVDSNLTGINHNEFVSGDITTDDTLMKRWRNKIGKVSDSNEADMMVYWVPSNCTPAKLEDIIANNPFKPDLVIMDYAGDMKANLKGIPDYDARSHAHIYSGLKEIAGKYHCVLYTAQQQARGHKKTSTESGSWSDIASAKADIMLGVEITKEDEDFMTEINGTMVSGRMTISIVKGRNIPKCKTHIIPFFHRMSWLEREEEEMSPTSGFKDVKTDKQESKEKLETASSELNSAIQGKSMDSFMAED